MSMAHRWRSMAAGPRIDRPCIDQLRIDRKPAEHDRQTVTGEAKMAKNFTFVALVNAREGENDAFSRWHSDTHLPQVVQAAGFSGGRRMQLVPGTCGDDTAYQYLVLFDLHSDDPTGALGKMGTAVKSGEIEMFDTLAAPVWSGLFEEIAGAEFKA
jgi:hypothetical protein